MTTGIDFEARNKTVRDVLFANYAYQIPRYQRPYAWDIDQAAEFWNDLVSTDQSPFLGSLIFNYEPYEKNGYIDIIDGQQRLITITIFVAVLRDVARTLDTKKAELYQRNDIAFEDSYTGNMTYRIIPGEQIREFLEKNIQQVDNSIAECKPITPEEVRIKKNYDFFADKVRDELRRFNNKSDQLKILDDLRKRVSNFTVIHIQIANEEQAYEIFETTNARGVDLSVADLLKNLVFKQLPPTADKDFAKQMWEDMTSAVEATNTEVKKFIRYYWLSKHPAVTEKRLFREIKKNTVNYRALLDDMSESADLYNTIVQGSKDDFQGFKHGDRIYKALAALRLMKVSQCYVLFLSILRNFNKLGTDPTRIFEMVEKFTFQYSVIGKLPGNKTEKIFAKHAKMIEDAVTKESEKHLPGKIQSIFADLERELRSEAPSADYFMDEFEKVCYRNSDDQRMLIKYILSEVDNKYRATHEEMIDFDNVNIEHLLPQKPEKAWGVKKGDIKGYVNRLGNLTLVDKKINSKIGNKSLKEKIEVLKDSQLPINRALLEGLQDNGYKWDEEHIAVRHRELARLACQEIWKL